MSNIKVKTERILTLAQTIDDVNNKLVAQFGEVENTIASVAASWSSQSFELSKNAFNAIKGNFYDQRREALSQHSQYLISVVVDGYFNTEEKNRRELDDLINGMPNGGSVGNAIKNDSRNSRLPEWAKKQGATPAYYAGADGTEWNVAEYNKDGTVSCTYYTLRRLRERGLGFPFKTAASGEANGGNWFANCTGDVSKYEGANCFDDLVASRELPVKNVVMSCSEPSPWGHVMLIDEITTDAEGHVIFISSDTYPPMKNINASNEAKVRQKKEFEDWYTKWNGSIIGCVVIGEN